jgi:hypothetical protein
MSDAEASEVSISFHEIFPGAIASSEGKSKLRTLLKERGIAIVTDVISSEECENLSSLWGDDLNDLLPPASEVKDPVLREEVVAIQSAERSERSKLWPIGTDLSGASGLVFDRGLPYGRFAWAARGLPQIRGIYEQVIYEESDLVTGLDLVFFRPSGHREAEKTSFSMHVDQNKHDPVCGEFEVYQSALYIWPALTEADSTTVVWPNSHIEIYEEIMSDANPRIYGNMGMNYIEIRSLEDKELKKTLYERSLSSARR